MLSQVTYIERADDEPLILKGALSERQVLEAAIDATSYRHYGCRANGGSQPISIEAVDRQALGVVEEHAPTKRRSRKKVEASDG